MKSGTLTLLHVGSEDGLPRIPSPEIPGWTLESIAMTGDVVDTILEVSDEREADLIAMGTRGQHGFLGLLRGTTTERVLRGQNVRCSRSQRVKPPAVLLRDVRRDGELECRDSASKIPKGMSRGAGRPRRSWGHPPGAPLIRTDAKASGFRGPGWCR